MKLTLLSAADLRAALPMPAAIAAMQAAFVELSAGQAVAPHRIALSVPAADGLALFMPAYLPGSGLGAKIVSVFPHNREHGRPIISGLVVVLDPASGEPVALCDGGFLTAWRTGAASGAATALLAAPEAAVGAVLLGAPGGECDCAFRPRGHGRPKAAALRAKAVALNGRRIGDSDRILLESFVT